MVAPAFVMDSYVDHTLSNNLDSTYAFEGPEKLLEIWLWPSADQIPSEASEKGLRGISLEKWEEILDLVNCKILSRRSSTALDAYLLSESSLFVFPHKLILKTCGTTTTLACIDKFFEIARSALGTRSQEFTDLTSKTAYRVFYSRRCFMFPDKQVHVHTDWKHEVSFLNKHFTCGKSYVVGDFTSDDHWYLYTGGDGRCNSLSTPRLPDQTFEVLMTRLDPVKAEQFVSSRVPGDCSEDSDEHDLGHTIGTATMLDSGITSIFDTSSRRSVLTYNSIPSPELSDNMDLSDDDSRDEAKHLDFIHDAFSFTPCGFSSNSVSKGSHGYYYTLHITPESGWSYASFETNFPFDSHPEIDITDVLANVLSIFEPGRFSVTLFSDSTGKNNKKSTNGFSKLANCDRALNKMGYHKQEKAVYDLKGNYNLLYLNFEKQI